MPKYTVTIEFLLHQCVEVEAASPDEAKERVDDMDIKAIFDNEDTMPVSDLEDGIVIDATDENGNTAYFA